MVLVEALKMGANLELTIKIKVIFQGRRSLESMKAAASVQIKVTNKLASTKAKITKFTLVAATLS